MSSLGHRVICLDTVMIDFALIVDALPPRGGDALSSARLVTAGGGYNMMSAARRQGLDVVYAGQLGHGRFADIAAAVLADEGISLAVAAQGTRDLGVCVVLVEATGERTFITSPGAELSLRPEELAAVAVVPGDVVYVSGYNVVYPELAPTVTHWLSTLAPEVVVAFDPGPRAADIDHGVMAHVMGRTDWLLCNAAEARHMSSESEAWRCAQVLHDRWGFDRVVVRDGAQGCSIASDDGVWDVPGFETKVVDTNGAGDVHNGVVIAELGRGSSFEEATLRANAAAAIAIASFGPATCPERGEVDSLLSRHPRQATRREG